MKKLPYILLVIFLAALFYWLSQWIGTFLMALGFAFGVAVIYFVYACLHLPGPGQKHDKNHKK